MNKFQTYCEKYGFVSDKTKVEFERIISNHNFKTLHIEIYSDNPYMLFLRSIEKNVMVTLEDNRVIVRKNDKHKTTITDILFDSIDGCIVKQYSDSHYEIIFTIHNLCYKLLVII